MNTCPTCAATYPLDFTHCPKDGSPLTPNNPWANGSVIRDKYRIAGVIGAGGMATVYKAEHIHFREQKALKVIHSDLAADGGFVKRFIQEAVLTRLLQHPHAVRVDDIERAEDGRPFMVMELIDGVPLTDAMSSGPLPLTTAATIAQQIAEALSAAHALGMVHRDIKPGNIVLQRKAGEVHVKVLDFGIAKIRASYSAENSGTRTALTFAGAVIGTPSYMSPEQAAGNKEDAVDGRSDLYSLGVVLYQMLAARLPLVADSELELLVAHIKAQPTPLQTVRPDLPAPVCSLVMACLAKEREARPRDCGEFIQRLRAALAEKAPEPEKTVIEMAPLPVPDPVPDPAPAPPPEPERTFKNKSRWLIAAATLSFAMVGFALMHHASQPPPVHRSIAAPVVPKPDVHADALTVPEDRKPPAPPPVKRKKRTSTQASGVMDISGPPQAAPKRKRPSPARKPPEVDLQ